MTDKKLTSVMDFYESLFETFPQDDHLRTMIPKMRVFLAEGRREKLMRWLGFIQGALWQRGVPLEELKNHNRPETE